MFVYEIAPRGDFSKSQIIIVDCGVGFPEEDAFGVDLQIPDTTYLLDKKTVSWVFLSPMVMKIISVPSVTFCRF